MRARSWMGCWGSGAGTEPSCRGETVCEMTLNTDQSLASSSSARDNNVEAKA